MDDAPLVHIEGADSTEFLQGGHVVDEGDLVLFGLISDPLTHAELLWQDPNNKEYGGCFKWRDHQYPLLWMDGQENIVASSRDVGKSMSVQAKACAHAFKRNRAGLMIGAPERIHLKPLTTAIENRILETKLVREFLATDPKTKKTGISQLPYWRVQFIDGTYIEGRIPNRDGRGFKGSHTPDLIIDEGQDMTTEAYVEVIPTIQKEYPDWSYTIYGVHSGDRTSQFYELAEKGKFRLTRITMLQKESWSAEQKQSMIAQYGSTSSPDYRRNVYGEAGDAASAWFVLHRLVANQDQDTESRYNMDEYVHQRVRSEEFENAGLTMRQTLDLPRKFDEVFVGADIGLTTDPTVITLWSRGLYKRYPSSEKKEHLKLLRRYTLERIRAKDIRAAFYAIAWHCGDKLRGVGMDATGLGAPIFQELEDDEDAPANLMDRAWGWKFNELVPVYVDPEFVQEDAAGRMRDQYGSTVVVEKDRFGNERLVTKMPMLEAGTRQLRDWVDDEYLILPFDAEVISDMKGETQQRVKALKLAKKKPHSFHILDSMRTMAMAFKMTTLNELIAGESPGPVSPWALLPPPPDMGGMEHSRYF